MEETYIRVDFFSSCRVIAGHNLAKKDIFGASDPYLRIDLIDSREEVEDTVITKNKKRTLNPKVSINQGTRTMLFGYANHVIAANEVGVSVFICQFSEAIFQS